MAICETLIVCAQPDSEQKIKTSQICNVPFRSRCLAPLFLQQNMRQSFDRNDLDHHRRITERRIWSSWSEGFQALPAVSNVEGEPLLRRDASALVVLPMSFLAVLCKEKWSANTRSQHNVKRLPHHSPHCSTKLVCTWSTGTMPPPHYPLRSCHSCSSCSSLANAHPLAQSQY